MSSPPPVVEAAWSLEPVATERGLDLVFTAPQGAPESPWSGIRISLDRAEARAFARAMMAAAGDATERTFKPQGGAG